MLYRKIGPVIEEHLKRPAGKILLIDGARQTGKTFIIRHVGQKLFRNYVEINFALDAEGERLFENTRTVSDFYLQLSMIAGDRLGEKEDTLVFLDEIQQYPHLLTLLKFLRQDDRFTYIASGSLLGVTLKKTTSIPIGSIERIQMYPLDFEEFLLANGIGTYAIDVMKKKFASLESLDESTHDKILGLFKKYLLVGGLPDAVNEYLLSQNIQHVRAAQTAVHSFYSDDASKYETENSKKLKIRRIFEMIPSNLENKKKRVVFKEIENKTGKRYSDYQDEFEYLIFSGIALDVKAISNPVFPLTESAEKNLLKLYLNDVGILTGILYRNSLKPILDTVPGINLGTVYESAVAQELKAHGFSLYYYDNRKNGEVDFLIDDHSDLSIIPIEVKSGKDYTVHRALNHFVENDGYKVNKAFVLSNEREIRKEGKIIYLPVYFSMFLTPDAADSDPVF